MTTALEFLLGKGKLADSFDAAFSDKPASPGSDGYRIRLTPKKKSSFSALYLLIDKNDFQVLETFIEDFAGNTNRVVFNKVKINRGLKDEIFKLVIPPGVEVVPLPKDSDFMP
jgi:outer membrane lipoprotein-sorting protein